MSLPRPTKLKECQFLVANGILTKPGDINGWTDIAENFYEDRNFMASRYEYFSGALTRWIYQSKRVKEIIHILKRSLRPVIYVGHSNAADILSKVIQKSRYNFPAVHLFAPATKCCFKANGFNTALKSGRIGKLFLYGSNNDEILGLGQTFTGWLSPIGLGYGNLGQDGPANVDPSVKDRVILDWRDSYGHSTWFSKKNLNKSLELTLRL